ncbi:MAG: geranylgeranylglyceryl/heptaprenylglyceryl phosphate synthase [Candidatus Poribacteria bacterium]|nr:geranylgeranylglyceryl/heptaprenylglyceryl phosphate synthase [Candidatus Poribacteria bacterium]
MDSTLNTLATLERVAEKRGAGYLVLVDPDNLSPEGVAQLAEAARDSDVDGFLVGGSLLMRNSLDDVVRQLRERSGLPTVLFPGGSSQLSRHADAILFLSLMSGRNPDFLIGEHVRAAPIIHEYKLEAIPTAYLLIEGGAYTSVQFMSGTHPIPRDKNDIAVAHALAAQYLGMRLIYLEGGSGAKWSVPEEMIAAVGAYAELPIIVGGGITKPEMAASKVRAGARFIVTGNVIERDPSASLLKEFADAAHQR